MSNCECIPPSEIGIAIQDFIPKTSTDLSVKKGHLVKVTNIYYEAINLNTNQKGFIPISYVAEEHNVETESWYFGNINRKESEELLKIHDCGTFLVRSGGRGLSHKYTLSITSKKGIRHYKILYDRYRYYLENGGDFNSIKSLIEFCKNKFNGYSLDMNIKHLQPFVKLQGLSSKKENVGLSIEMI